MILVRNATNTSGLLPPYPYNSWIEYWEDNSGNRLNIFTEYNCPAGDCNKTCYRADLEGSHVQKVFDNTNAMYIVPLCSSCNHRTAYFYVDENLLVPAP